MRRILVGSLITIPLVFIAAALLLVGQTQTLPAPTADRVGFPTGYQNSTDHSGSFVPVSITLRVLPLGGEASDSQFLRSHSTGF